MNNIAETVPGGNKGKRKKKGGRKGGEGLMAVCYHSDLSPVSMHFLPLSSLKGGNSTCVRTDMKPVSSS